MKNFLSQQKRGGEELVINTQEETLRVEESWCHYRATLGQGASAGASPSPAQPSGAGAGTGKGRNTDILGSRGN